MYVVAGGMPRPKDELRGNQTFQSRREIAVLQRNDSRKQIVVELAANACAYLCDFLYRGEPIEAGHQGVVQGYGYRQRREWPVENVTVAGVPEQSGFKHSLRSVPR